MSFLWVLKHDADARLQANSVALWQSFAFGIIDRLAFSKVRAGDVFNDLPVFITDNNSEPLPHVSHGAVLFGAVRTYKEH